LVDGALVLDKPAGWTSHDVVNKIRRLAGTKKVGHLGTLDPMATGVLPLVLGRATRLAQFFTRAEKAYQATVCFGFATSTGDAEGEPSTVPMPASFSREQLEQWLDGFRGTFLQKPPAVSAKKVAGVPAYKLARRNVEVDLPPVEVTISSLDVTSFDLPHTGLMARCTAGTYMRSLAHDLGVVAGCGAHLAALRRTQAGDFDLSQARTIEQLEALASEGLFDSAIVPAARLLPELTSQVVDALTASQIRQGRDFRISPFRQEPATRLVKAISPEGELLAIGEERLPLLYHPILVFQESSG
jgi:tRNA pseudouridine55 synthase